MSISSSSSWLFFHITFHHSHNDRANTNRTKTSNVTHSEVKGVYSFFSEYHPLRIDDLKTYSDIAFLTRNFGREESNVHINLINVFKANKLSGGLCSKDKCAHSNCYYRGFLKCINKIMLFFCLLVRLLYIPLQCESGC